VTQSNYPACLKAVLREEGGNDDDPHDPGGRTSRGITQRVYDAYREQKARPHRDVYQMDNDELKDIYKFQYWNEVNGDYLPTGIDLCMFDFAVNSGPRRAAREMQQVLGVQSDGTVGNLTLQSFTKYDINEIIDKYKDHRMAFLKSLSTWSYFGGGWKKRVDRITALAHAMARNQAVAPIPDTKPTAEVLPKADPRDKTLSGTNTGKGAIITGAGTIGSAITDTADKIEPLGNYGTIFKVLFAVVLLAGLAFTVYSIMQSIKRQGVA
jgi:lysozyme family protein